MASFFSDTAKKKNKNAKKLFKLILKKFPNHNPNKPLPISLSEIAKLDIQSPFGERATLYHLQRLERLGRIISPQNNNSPDHEKPKKKKLNYKLLENRIKDKELEKRVERIKERFSIKYY
mgnify:CR=1 FL=1